MEKALIVIDYTNDFIHEEGALSCGVPGKNLDDYIAELMKTFKENDDFIVQAVDVHIPGDEYHPETKLFPTHNVRSTWGRELYGKVAEMDARISIHKDNHYTYMDKTRYSAFAGTNLELKLRERGIQEVHLAGVCTDICVLHTAIDAYNKGFKIVVHEKGVASFDPTGHNWSLGHFKNVLGATIL